MRILFLYDFIHDYVSDGLFHGLRLLLGKDCVDVPRYDCMYSPLGSGLRAKLRGRGFTMYGRLPDVPGLEADRFLWHMDLGSFDRVVVANIWYQWELVWRIAPRLKPEQLVVIDGDDSPRIFPWSRKFLSQPWAYLTPLQNARYFKRELYDGDPRGLPAIPGAIARRIRPPQSIEPISISIPEDLVREPSARGKVKTFTSHIVDPDVIALAGNATSSYAFEDEARYYDDIAGSRYGVTTKRAGWDCLRHYEIAAGGAVPCFRDLHLKPQHCAPHGLNESNCIPYRSADDLRRRLESITAAEYELLLNGAHRWVREHTTRAEAERFLAAIA